MSNTSDASAEQEPELDPYAVESAFKAEFCSPQSGVLDAWYDPAEQTLMVQIDGMRASEPAVLDALETVPAPGEYRGLRTTTTLKARPSRP